MAEEEEVAEVVEAAMADIAAGEDAVAADARVVKVAEVEEARERVGVVVEERGVIMAEEVEEVVALVVAGVEELGEGEERGDWRTYLEKGIKSRVDEVIVAPIGRKLWNTKGVKRVMRGVLDVVPTGPRASRNYIRNMGGTMGEAARPIASLATAPTGPRRTERTDRKVYEKGESLGDGWFVAGQCNGPTGWYGIL
ncbi:hypothetical protein B9Z19DRAFT_1127247 [Tuber borchii]|uniref:Uncharacterized protein n=1 Tax=Tuber borchii TaxID=42251 RepID=A0A2T6ZRF9_TUBBO|nr:hypothetical protein B9Z19DRAFT_1127247 [Tuber borchii]